MIALFDLDSLVYDALYRVASISQMKDFISEYGKKKARNCVVEMAYNRMEQMLTKLLYEVEQSTTEITKIEYYLTYCLANKRNQIEPTYKAHRKRNKWANMLRNYIIQEPNFDVIYDFEWEADDLIFDRANKIKQKGEQYVVISKDKDLKQIGGLYFDYYKQKTGELDEYFKEIKEFRGLTYIDEIEAKKLVYLQILKGDSVDNIKGLKNIGDVKSKKILQDAKNEFGFIKRTYGKYKEFYGSEAKKEYRKTEFLIRIGKRKLNE
jgi:5'-3' exonuclease